MKCCLIGVVFAVLAVWERRVRSFVLAMAGERPGGGRILHHCKGDQTQAAEFRRHRETAERAGGEQHQAWAWGEGEQEEEAESGVLLRAPTTDFTFRETGRAKKPGGGEDCLKSRRLNKTHIG